MFDPVKIYADEFAQVLEPGERIVAAPYVAYMAGREQTGPEDNVVTFDVIDGLTVPKWNRAAESAISGLTLNGSQASLAADVARAFDGHAHLVLTDARVLAVDLPLNGTLVVKGSWPLDAVAEIRHDPRLGQHGRLRLTMSDGSMVRLVAGLFFWRRAQRLVTAWRELVGLPR
ncbi:hypothetical protein [Tessaracoccus sp. MC1756]|uniref:hypothetical protein n=1 Tax=Tessaracoccus sp. MC1756 TaxID=2760311 RepID=UPI0016038512|nr:hypothetical protein [Tessaracoccus sp. MC1756]MBB1509364.1 hypothetical protein [Tessaracoccus sp. MC1756]